jgi:ubiquinone biosynthesis protein UbiJ
VQTLQATLTSPAELKNLWEQIQQLQKKTETLEKQMDDAKKKAAPQKK